MTKEQVEIIEGLFVSKFKNKGWDLFESRMPHPGGLGLLEYGSKPDQLAKLVLLKFFSQDEKESACLSWTDYPDHNPNFPKFVQLNFGFSQFQTEDFELMILMINNIYK